MDFVCFSVNNWEKRRARKQQFMLHLSLRSDVGRVLYVEPALNMARSLIFFASQRSTPEGRMRWARAWAGRVDPVPESEKLFIYTPLSFFPWSFRFSALYRANLWLIHFFLQRRLRRLRFQDVVLWLYHPFDAPLLRWFKPRRVRCFDWAEKWSEYFQEYRGRERQEVSRREEEMVRGADLVFVTSDRLLELARRLNLCSSLLRDGTIPEIFSSFGGAVPDDLRNVPRPIVGYVGTLGDRIDVALVRTLSQRLSACSFVFVGDIQPGRVDVAPLSSLKNVYFLGAKPYASLPGYLMNFDVCMLPYVPDPQTAPPTKIYDYLATGKPVVTTALASLAPLRGQVALASTPEDFVAALERSLKEADPAVSERRRQIARENSWAARAAEIIGFIASAAPKET